MRCGACACSASTCSRSTKHGEVRGETYREIGREAIAGGAEAATAARLRVQTAPVLLDVAAGSYYVSLEQPLANLAIAALEPESPAGYAANGVIGKRQLAERVCSTGRACAWWACRERGSCGGSL